MFHTMYMTMLLKAISWWVQRLDNGHCRALHCEWLNHIMLPSVSRISHSNQVSCNTSTNKAISWSVERSSSGHVSWKSWNFYCKFSGPGVLEKTLVLEIYLQGPGICYAMMRDGSFLLQIDMFLQTKIAIIVATRCIFWAEDMPKYLRGWGSAPDPAGAYSAPTDPLAAVCRYI